MCPQRAPRGCSILEPLSCRLHQEGIPCSLLPGSCSHSARIMPYGFLISWRGLKTPQAAMAHTLLRDIMRQFPLTPCGNLPLPSSSVAWGLTGHKRLRAPLQSLHCGRSLEHSTAASNSWGRQQLPKVPSTCLPNL